MDTDGSAPEIAVVVPSHDRPLRLRWLLNALAEQTLARERFEVVVVHDSAGPETEELLRSHPLAGAGALTHLSFAPGPGPAEKRNAGWRRVRAPLVAFTDDDCRPPPHWLERALEAAQRCPGAIVQGETRPDPDEATLTRTVAFHRSQWVDPPEPWAQTCNIVYPRELLEELGGFAEHLPLAAGEDTDLAFRARQAGAVYVGAPWVGMFHMVEAVGLWNRIRGLWRWRHLPYLVKAYPPLRRDFHLRLFWKPGHAWLALGLAGAGLAFAHPAFLLLGLGWAAKRRPAYGGGMRGLARSLVELPGRATIDLAEMAVCAVGSLKYRTLLL